MNLLQVKGFLLFFCGVLTTAQGVRFGSQPNPPSWPPSVAVFDPSDDAGTIMGRVMAAFETNGGHDPPNHGQFSDKRYAFLFKPGSYKVDVFC